MHSDGRALLFEADFLLVIPGACRANRNPVRCCGKPLDSGLRRNDGSGGNDGPKGKYKNINIIKYL
jgi:hypothetical protein